MADETEEWPVRDHDVTRWRQKRNDDHQLFLSMAQLVCVRVCAKNAEAQWLCVGLTATQRRCWALGETAGRWWHDPR